MRRVVVMGGVAALLVLKIGASPASAEGMCEKPSGAVIVRNTACKGKEKSLDLSAFGAEGEVAGPLGLGRGGSGGNPGSARRAGGTGNTGGTGGAGHRPGACRRRAVSVPVLHLSPLPAVHRAVARDRNDRQLLGRLAAE